MAMTSCKKTDTNQYELVVKVSAEDFEKALAQAFKKNANKLQVPGFRKGKAPRSIVEKCMVKAYFSRMRLI